MARSPFVLCTRKLKSGTYWYARFYDCENQNHYVVRSTGILYSDKKGHDKLKAFQTAQAMPRTSFEHDKDPLFLEYVLSFWTSGSTYLKTKELAEKKPLSKYYVEQNHDGIQKHVAIFKRFQKIHLSQLTTGMIEDWKLNRLENGTGARRLNAILQSIRIPVRYAFERQEIALDPFIHVKPIPYSPTEKGILNREELQTLLTIQDTDPRITLAVQLAALCGLRRGEVRGLQWNDIDLETRFIQVRHNYIDGEETKACKWGSARTTILPQSMKRTLLTVKNLSEFTAPDDFVLCSLDDKTKPIGVSAIRAGFTRMLDNGGINVTEQKTRNLTFHGLRHTFVSLARAAGIPDIIVQNLAGHKSAEMMNHYSHGGQVIDFAETRKKLETIEEVENTAQG